LTTFEELEGQHITLVRESTADTSAAQMGGKDPWLESQHATGSGGFLCQVLPRRGRSQGRAERSDPQSGSQQPQFPQMVDQCGEVVKLRGPLYRSLPLDQTDELVS
jgi:hypothetical protein